MSEIVTDPNLLAQLNGTQKEALPAAKPVGEDSTSNKIKRTALGAVQGAVLDPLAAVGQFLPENYGGKLADKQLQWYENKRKELGGEGFDPARMAGNVGGTFIPILGAAGKAGQLAKGAGLVKAGAISGAASGALQPVLPDAQNPEQSFWGEKAKQVGTGAVLGGALNKLLGKPVQSVAGEGGIGVPGSNIEKMMATFPEFKPTIGQQLGGRAARWEEKFTSTPVIGEAIRDARAKALSTQNVGMMNRALQDAGLKLDKGTTAGRGMFDEAYNKLTDKYSTLLDDAQLSDPQALMAKIYGKMDTGTGKSLATADQLADSYKPGIISNDYNRLSEDGQKTFRRIMDSSLFSKFGKDPQGNKSLSLSGSQFKAYEEDLKEIIGDYMSGGGEDRMIGRMLKKSLGEVYDSLTSAKPGVAQELKKLNKSYAQYKTLEKASTASSTGEGLFTPAQSIRAAKQGNKNQNQVARGKGLLQDESELSNKILTQQTPDSGTAGRLGARNLSDYAKGIPGAAAYHLIGAGAPQAIALKRALQSTRPGAHLANNSQSYTSAASKAIAADSPPEEEYAAGGFTGPLSSMSSFGFGGGPLSMLNR